MMFKRTRSLFMILVIVVLCLAAYAGYAQPQPPAMNVDDLVAQVVKARDLTSGYVALANSSFKDKSAPDYIQAQKLYIGAYSDNNAWKAYLVSALRDGHFRGLNSDPAYDVKAEKATSSSTAFVQYVDEKTKPQTKAVITILSSLADLGVKLWTDISDKIKKDRDVAATNFDNATKWKSWDELTGKEMPPADAAKPKITGAVTPNK